ncbi:class I SAM-dependent methyltransferase [Phormidium tenue FACHB-886]|nr:class I SAM-dependent methyltransferase [Phormidium tenue FACHB-886]
MSVQAAYDDWSRTYDVDKNLTRDLDQAVTRETLMGLKCRLAIELGCGTGKNTLLLSQIAHEVHAIDFSEHMIEKAREKIHSDNVIFSIADVTKPWADPSGAADLITCNLILEHIKDLSFIFAEASRVLVEEGYFFISELHPFKQYGGTKANFQRNQEIVQIEAFVHHISDFLSTAKAHSFILEDLQEWWHEQDQGKPPRIVSILFKKRH